jgi:GDP-mannose 6-dehydrogenase
MEAQITPTDTHIAVLGLGYVGCVTAACLANLGHRVTGVDKDEYKVQRVLAGQAPFYEPGLEQIIQVNVETGRLTATTKTAEGIQDADIALICVGTPSEKNGNLGLGQLRRVVEEIGDSLPGRSKPLIVAVRSTVFPGTCEEIVESALHGHKNVQIVSNPEFLREGTAVMDFIKPALVVIGGSSEEAVKRVARIYDPLGIEPCLVSLRTAEMIKYACNAFHAVKVCFANEIGALCEKLGVQGPEVMKTFCRDERLNISAAYLKPGFAFGGSCLPKDLRALVYRAGRLDVDLPLLGAALPSNQAHLHRAIEAVLDAPAERIGIVGLSFKENTDDLRESPVVSMLEQLIGKGRNVRVYDEHIKLDEIYGTNRNYLLNAIPHVGRLLAPSFANIAEWADLLVVTQKPSFALAEEIRRSELRVLDLGGSLAVNVKATLIETR